MRKERPNLFHFGTGELTHDAILAWCLAWGNYPKSELYELAVGLLELLTGHKIIIEKIKIIPEKHNIDVFVLVNEEVVIAIEDKIDTYARAGQLEKYKKVIDKKYPDRKRFYSYVTVGDEANYQKNIENEYKVIERKDLLVLVEKYKEASEILADYYDYLLKKEESFQSYQKEELTKWTDRGWQGFFREELNTQFTEGAWGRVNNQRGGFQAFYWDFTEYSYQSDIPITIYLQVEGASANLLKNKVAFKVEVANKHYQSAVRNYLWEQLENLLERDSTIKRPKRFGKGLTMTYAEITNFKTKDELNRAIDLAMKTQEQLHEILRKE